MSQISLAAEPREDAGKGVARKLRATGRIPGVLYGRDASPTLFSVEEKNLDLLMKKHGLNFIVELDINGKKHTCMIADYQKDVFQRHLLHVDLKLIDLKRPVVVKVPVIMSGDNEVRGRGGIAQLYLRDLKVKMLPTEIPKTFTVDVGSMKPGESLKLNAVPTPDNMTLIDPPGTTVVNILAPRALAAARQQAAEG